MAERQGTMVLWSNSSCIRLSVQEFEPCQIWLFLSSPTKNKLTVKDSGNEECVDNSNSLKNSFWGLFHGNLICFEN